MVSRRSSYVIFPTILVYFLHSGAQDRNGVHILTGLTRWGGDNSSYQNDGEARHPVTKSRRDYYSPKVQKALRDTQNGIKMTFYLNSDSTAPGIFQHRIH